MNSALVSLQVVNVVKSFAALVTRLLAPVWQLLSLVDDQHVTSKPKDVRQRFATFSALHPRSFLKFMVLSVNKTQEDNMTTTKIFGQTVSKEMVASFAIYFLCQIHVLATQTQASETRMRVE